jgi:hypothetical protein
MTPQLLNQIAITPALSLLPERMDSRDARVFLVAVALQESRIEHRVQIGGPAKGYWQFERSGGVVGVLQHRASAPHIEQVYRTLNYPGDSRRLHTAIEHNDVLAAAFARLLLWTLPQALPRNEKAGWDQYISAWRPGKPHRSTWAALYAQAQEAVA